MNGDSKIMKSPNWNKIPVSIPPDKKAISIRLDDDILKFFKKSGGKYQSHMNAVLRAYIEWEKPK